MASDSDTETLPLQGDAAARSGRATRRVVAAVATLVALALAYSSTVPRAAPRGALLDESAPLAGTSGTYGWSCKDCSGGSAGSLTWSCNCKDTQRCKHIYAILICYSADRRKYMPRLRILR